jgi:isopentenyldiphosphate isomerase
MINTKELLFSVDENNNPIEPQPRDISHAAGIWHRTSHVWVINNQGNILCQQRSLLKDSNPGLWEPFFGGHLAPKQSYQEAALNELEEELGIRKTASNITFYKTYKYVPGTEFQGIFTTTWDGDITTLQLEEDEVEQVAWHSPDDIRRLVVDSHEEPWTRLGYESELLDRLAITH